MTARRVTTFGGFRTLSLIAAGLLASPLVTEASAQTDPERVERLKKEQQEILRKTERLQALMERLRTRYEREGKKEQVDLLTAGLEHLKEAQILRDVASIRDDLGATALSEAVRKQRNGSKKFHRKFADGGAAKPRGRPRRRARGRGRGSRQAQAGAA